MVKEKCPKVKLLINLGRCEKGPFSGLLLAMNPAEDGEEVVEYRTVVAQVSSLGRLFNTFHKLILAPFLVCSASVIGFRTGTPPALFSSPS